MYEWKLLWLINPAKEIKGLDRFWVEMPRLKTSGSFAQRVGLALVLFLIGGKKEVKEKEGIVPFFYGMSRLCV